MTVPLSVHIVAADAAGLIERIVEADELGLDTAWLTVGGAAPDPFAVFTAAAHPAERITFGTSIVPTYPRHPITMAQGAMTVDQVAPGRLKLGVGPSHRPGIEGTWGLPFNKPLSHLREYVTILNALLNEGEVDFDGEQLHAHIRIAEPTQVQVMISALRTGSFRLSGELTEGGISWMCPLPYIRDVATPAQQEGADAAGRPKPAMIVHTPIVVSEDREAVRAAARQQFGFYQRLPFYSRMLQAAGYEEAAGGEFTDRMADGLIISGSANEVADRVRSLGEYGVDEMLAAIVQLPEGGREARRRTLELLGELASE
ncbi:MAG: LLM class flavin-dependent oxidoreductase [Chloroflexota bacterium]|nr:LLM class flavin-dependent oxidoreductase [Chloroflexota bacterium]